MCISCVSSFSTNAYCDIYLLQTKKIVCFNNFIEGYFSHSIVRRACGVYVTLFLCYIFL